MLSDDDFLRYSRQLLLQEFGPEGQHKLRQSRVLIVGLGGLGSPAALYLAAAGVGKLLLADDDTLHISNLQRQILYTTDECGQPKATLARRRLLALNPHIDCIALTQRITETALRDIVEDVDLVLDCSDNMNTRQMINAVCVTHGKTLISGSAMGFSGQLMAVSAATRAYGCYRCLWPDEHEPEHNCRTAGVYGPVVGVIGTLQALEALNILSGQPSALTTTLRLFDGRQQTWRTLTRQRSQHCPVCGEIK